MPERNDEPASRVDQVADALMAVAKVACEEKGLELGVIVVMLAARGADEGEPNAVCSGEGFEDDDDMMQFVMANVANMAKAMGGGIAVFPIGEG